MPVYSSTLLLLLQRCIRLGKQMWSFAQALLLQPIQSTSILAVHLPLWTRSVHSSVFNKNINDCFLTHSRTLLKVQFMFMCQYKLFKYKAIFDRNYIKSLRPLVFPPTKMGLSQLFPYFVVVCKRYQFTFPNIHFLPLIQWDICIYKASDNSQCFTQRSDLIISSLSGMTWRNRKKLKLNPEELWQRL